MESRGLLLNSLGAHSKKWKDLEEMDESLDTYDLSKLNQENINYLSRSVKSNKTEAVIRTTKKKISSLYAFTVNSSRLLRKS